MNNTDAKDAARTLFAAMTKQHQPLTPPPELRRQWRMEAPPYRDGYVSREDWLIDRASEWGYDQRGEVNEAKLQQARDQELEACCEWLDREGWSGESRQLRAARRPKPPSLKEQALIALDDTDLDAAHENILRRALEALPDD